MVLKSGNPYISGVYHGVRVVTSRLNYPINVKIPQLYAEIIDQNLKEGRALRKAGFRSRAQFVREAVKEKLMKLDLLSSELQKKLEAQKRR